MSEIIAEIAKSLGVPQRIFVGEPSSSKTPAMEYLERSEAEMVEWREEFEIRILTPILEDAWNPWEFVYLFPLGKRAYRRQYSKLPKYKIKWKE